MIRKTEDFECLRGKKIYLFYETTDLPMRLYPVLIDKGYSVAGFITKNVSNESSSLFGLPVISLKNYNNDGTIILCISEGNRRKNVELLLDNDIYKFVMLHQSYVFLLVGSIPTGVMRYFENTNYMAYAYEEVEDYHALMAPKNNPHAFKARIPSDWWFKAFEKYNQVNLNDNSFQEKYEKIWGKYTEVNTIEETDQSKKMFDNYCTMYSIRSHFDTTKPTDKIPSYLIPLQAGAALTDKVMCECRDNTGDNISERNADFSECSAIYWAWKNGDRKKYIGVCHYRRFLSANTAEMIDAFNNDVDLIQTVPTVMYPSIKRFFIKNFFYKKDYSLMQKAIQEKFPEYVETERNLGDGFFYLANNICVMKREWFDKMCKFVFGVILSMDDYYREKGLIRGDRYAGYYFEYLYSVFVMHHAHEMKIVYSNMSFLTTPAARNAYFQNVINIGAAEAAEEDLKVDEPHRLHKAYEVVADNGISFSILYILRMTAKKILRAITGKHEEKNENEDDFG